MRALAALRYEVCECFQAQISRNIGYPNTRLLTRTKRYCSFIHYFTFFTQGGRQT